MKFILALLPILLAPAPSAADLIANVNTVRAQYGLPSFVTSSQLMEAAQKQSEYQAAQGQGSHTGENGSTPTSRAKAAGFGGGQTVWISENISWGFSMSAPRSVEIWKQDGPHLLTMLSHYTHVGAGVAIGENGVTYYTLVAGWISGSPGTGMSNPQPDGNGGAYDEGAESAPPAATAAGSESESVLPVFNPVAVATPDVNGCIVHTVQSGQALYTISVVYEIALEALLSLNGLTENSIIRPGDEVLINLGQATATPMSGEPSAALQEEGSSAFQPDPTPTAALAPGSPTPRPTSAAALMQEAGAALERADTSLGTLAEGNAAVESIRTLGQIALVVLVFVAGALVLMGNLQDKR